MAYAAAFNITLHASQGFGDFHSKINELKNVPVEQRPAAIRALKEELQILQNNLGGLLRNAEEEAK